MTEQRTLSVEPGSPGTASARRLTGRDGIPDLKDRIEAALADPLLRRALPVAQDNMRFKRDDAVAAMGADAFEALRERGQAIRRHTIQHLQHYLDRLTERVKAQGGHVFFARTAEEAVDYVVRVAEARGVRTVIKSKSMVSEELELNAALEGRGVRPVETDLGEYIVQLAGHTPSHIIAPAQHLSREEIAAFFSREAGRELPAETKVLADYAREQLRREFLRADMGITGCNFAVAETGAVILVTNEGNGRMVTSLPPVQVTLMGMERVVPTMEDAHVLLDLLTRSATGQKASVYTTVTRGIRGPGEPDGPEEFHLVIVDNGRSALLGGKYEDALHCIRCGACMNVCPVYRHIGGHGYGWIYPGPIGAVLTPLYRGFEAFGDLPLASSLCGACTETCPVKIPLHDYLIELRTDQQERGGAPLGERLAFRAWAAVMARPSLYRLAQRVGRRLFGMAARTGRPWGPGPMRAWTGSREFPPVASATFRERWERSLGAEAAAGGGPARSAADARADVRAGLAKGGAGEAGAPGSASRGAGEGPGAAGEAASAAEDGAGLRGPDYVEQFAEAWRAAGGEVRRVEPGRDLGHALAELVRELGGGPVVRTADPRWAGTGVDEALARAGMAVHVWGEGTGTTRDDVAAAAVGLTWADGAMAATGTLMELAEPSKGRLVSLLPPVHVAVVAADTVMVDRGVAFRRLAEREEGFTCAAFITGPSRTADIQNDMTIGVHGPGRTVAVLVGASGAGTGSSGAEGSVR